MDSALQRAIQDRLVNGQLPCSAAMTIAGTLDITPADVGAAANQTDVRIFHCQLGLFGYGPKSEGKHKIVRPMAVVPTPVAERIGAVALAGGITCSALWEIAAELSLSRLEASAAAEALGLRVSHCQLGCFPRPKPEQ